LQPGIKKDLVIFRIDSFQKLQPGSKLTEG
jgi:hypothetical protein